MDLCLRTLAQRLHLNQKYTGSKFTTYTHVPALFCHAFVNSVSYVDITGTHYKQRNILVFSFDEEISVFGKIVDIIVTKSATVFSSKLHILELIFPHTIMLLKFMLTLHTS